MSMAVHGDPLRQPHPQTPTNTLTCTQTHTHLHTCTYTPANAHTHAHTCTHTHLHNHKFTPAHTHTRTHSHTQTHTPTSTSANAHTHTHAQTHIHPCLTPPHPSTYPHTKKLTLSAASSTHRMTHSRQGGHQTPIRIQHDQFACPTGFSHRACSCCVLGLLC